MIAASVAFGAPIADILLVQALRAHVAQGGDAVRGWLRALLDPQMSQALDAMHERPSEAWRAESLASRVAMSRSALPPASPTWSANRR